MSLPNEYRSLMRDALSEEPQDRPLKKRRKGRTEAIKVKEAEPEAEPESEPEIEPVIQEVEPVIEVESLVFEESDESDSDDDDIFEDVDLDNVQARASNQVGDVEVNYNQEKPKKKSNRNVIDKEEKSFRKQFHKEYIICMLVHGFIRNRWCNNEEIQKDLRKLVTTQIYDLLHPSNSTMNKSRKLLDGLKQLMLKWINYFRITSNKGLYKHDWYDWDNFQKRSPTDFDRFKKCLNKGRGGRDISAQGFLALLRSVDVHSRLVFSLQPPDFTNNKIINRQVEETKKPSLNIKDKLISLRKGDVSKSIESATQGEIEQKYPIFWAEVWDPFAQVWITIDPVIFKTIEIVKYKSKLEPPINNKFNSLTYVIGYDKKFGIRDITKRYAEKYYSKTIKKRITKFPKDKEWFDFVLNSISKRSTNKIDLIENEFFDKKQELEGMPDNIQDFKNHPNFILETQLRSNEFLNSNEKPIGLIKIKGQNKSLKVFKKSQIQALKTSRGWFQIGRVLKSGQQPLKFKKKNSAQLIFDDDETEDRLYAEYQTDLYIPPAISKDGLITKNAYGNLDVYVPSMIPEGGVHIVSEFAEDAAKKLGIDYAKAVTGFKFEKRRTSPKFNGIIISKDFERPLELVQNEIALENKEKLQILFDIKCLKGWDLLLTKLKIKQRLNKSHGRVDEEGEEEEEKDDDDDAYEEYFKNDQSESDDGDFELGNGGFIVDHSAGGFVDEPEHMDDAGDEDSGAGFVVDTGAGFINDGSHEDKDAGFNSDGLDDYEAFVDQLEDGDTGGGFIAEDEKEKGEDELDEYEAFMDQLEDVSDSEREQEEEVIEIESEPEVIEIDSETPLKTDEETPERDEDSEYEKAPIPDPFKLDSPNVNNFDTEMEIQFNEQIKQEKHENLQQETEESDEFEFDYDSE